MIATEFGETYTQFEKFSIWDVESMDAFFEGNEVLMEIFQNNFNMPLSEFNERRSEIEISNMDIMKGLLNQVGDKYFLIFTFHDDNHWELVKLQKQKLMNFGVDIENITDNHVYILTMDRRAGFDA